MAFKLELHMKSGRVISSTRLSPNKPSWTYHDPRISDIAWKVGINIMKKDKEVKTFKIIPVD